MLEHAISDMKTNFGHLHLFTFCSADQFCSRLKAGILNSMMKLYGEKVVTIIFNHIMVKDGLTKLMKPPKPKGHSSAKIWLQKSAKIFFKPRNFVFIVMISSFTIFRSITRFSYILMISLEQNGRLFNKLVILFWRLH